MAGKQLRAEQFTFGFRNDRLTGSAAFLVRYSEPRCQTERQKDTYQSKRKMGYYGAENLAVRSSHRAGLRTFRSFKAPSKKWTKKSKLG